MGPEGGFGKCLLVFGAAGVLLGGPIGHACRALSSSGMPNWSPGGFLGRSGGPKAVRGGLVLVPKWVRGVSFGVLARLAS